MKYLALALLLNLSALISFAQKTQDVVYLNNGSTIRGKIIENNNNQLKIESCCKNVFVFNQSEIQNVTEEPVTTEYPIKEFGYFNFTSIGTVFGSALNEKPAPFSLLMEHNFRTCKYFAFGAFSGLEMLNEMTAPVGGNIKLMLPTIKGNTYYLGISGGYSISLEKPKSIDYYYEISDAYGGTMFNSEIGAIFPMKQNLGLFIAAGYRYNELHYKRPDWFLTSIDRAMYFNRISLKIGLAFY
jgi:hypothetical protein